MGSGVADGFAGRMVAQFRATHDLRAGDPAFIDLLERLRNGAAEQSGGKRTMYAASPGTKGAEPSK